MAGPKATSLRYWLATTDLDTSWRSTTDQKSATSCVIQYNEEILPDAPVYVWAQPLNGSIHGWGYVPKAAYERSRNEALSWTRMEIVEHVNPPLAVRDLSPEPVLRPLPTEVNASPRLPVELSFDQVRALNRLITSRGAKAPPDPQTSSGPTSEDSPSQPSKAKLAKSGGRAATKKRATKAAAGSGRIVEDSLMTLEDLFEKYSVSYLPQTVLEEAAHLSITRKRHRNKVTSSCIMFALAAVGRNLMESEQVNAATFFYQWLIDNDESAYISEFDRFMDDAAEVVEVEPRDRNKAEVTANAVRIFEAAQHVAVLTTAEPLIDGRHLLAALLDQADGEVMGATSRFEGMNVDVSKLRRDFFTFVSDPHTEEEEVEKWRAILPPDVTSTEATSSAEPFQPSLPQIDADDLKSDDYLEITPEVEAFASIMAARDVKTPLSIGLFGDWGSGKSFFMRKLREQVSHIATEVRERPKEESAYFGNIVQIEFNAWHYVDAHLWASLVSHIFDNLSFTEQKNDAMAEHRKRLLLTQLESTLKAQTAANVVVEQKNKTLKEKEDALTRAERALDDRKRELKNKEDDLVIQQDTLVRQRREQAVARVGLRHLMRKGVWDKVKLNEAVIGHVANAKELLKLEGLPQDGRQLKAELSAAQSVVGRAQVMLTSILNDPHLWQKAVFLLIALIVLPIIATLVLSWVQASEAWKSLSMWGTNAIALFAAGYKWLKPRIAQASSGLEQLKEANREFDKLYQSAKQDFRTEVSQLEKTLNEKQQDVDATRVSVDRGKAEIGRRKEAIVEAREEVVAAQKQVDTTRKDVADTEAALREIEPGRMLARFIEDRASSSDYRQHLGITAMIREDFRKLSKLLVDQDSTDLKDAVAEMLKQYGADQNGEPTDGAEEDWKNYKIDRIVLYIDDLDRCPPKQVVDVLQAIHLLLAFELFVVVVGVDARWVRHSLKTQYRELLSEDPEETEEHMLVKTATPRDYVEKIFQVPYWLRPMSTHSSTGLLNGLIPHAESETSQLPPVGKVEQVTTVKIDDENVERKTSTIAVSNIERAVAADGATGESSSAGEAKDQGEARSGGASETRERDPEQRDKAKKAKPLVLLRPEGLKLGGKEKAAMVSLAKIIGRTPRTLKRFVNIYRIIKSSLNDSKLKAFKGTNESNGEYRAVIVLLGVAHGLPEFAPLFFRRLKERHEQSVRLKKPVGLKALLKEMAKDRPGDTVEWKVLVDDLTAFANKYSDDLSLTVLREWAPIVVRYTFQLGRMSDVI